MSFMNFLFCLILTEQLPPLCYCFQTRSYWLIQGTYLHKTDKDLIRASMFYLTGSSTNMCSIVLTLLLMVASKF